YIEETAVQLKRILRNGHIIILESTSFPGTTEEVLKKILDESGLKIEEDYFLGYSPERINPADKIFRIEDIPKIVSGYGNKSLELISLLYGHVFKTIVKANSIKAAESAKLLENIYRAVNISLINSMKIVLDAMGIDIYEVINLASTKPFGFQPFYPSPGMGGHCIPIDPFYLSYKAREFGVTAKFIELAGELDHTMPGYYFERILKKLNDLGILLKSANVLIVGVAYKPDTNDTRESPAIVFIEKFLDYKANVSYHDPLVPKLGPTRKFPKEMSSISLESELSKFDFVVLVTPHSSLDYEYLVENSKILFDIRNAIYKKLNVKFPNVYVI
ncbi:MAG: nucleotide sugar dehydrogenase, partial [Planctomycetota bacterium]